MVILPPTELALRYHNFQTYFQILQWKEGSNFHATEWHWAVKSNRSIPVPKTATQYILKIIICLYEIDCSSG